VTGTALECLGPPVGGRWDDLLAVGCRCWPTRSLHMTASATMRMWRSMSCAFWRPDPRHGDEPREPLCRLDIARRGVLV